MTKVLNITFVLLFLGDADFAETRPAQYELQFWAGAGARHDRRFVKTIEHPCSNVVLARVTRLPSSRTGGALVSEEAIERGVDGKVLARWPMPVDGVPAAVKRNLLMVSVGDDLWLWISEKGEIVSNKKPGSVGKRTIEYCAESKRFRKYDLEGCALFKDLRSGKERIINYEPPCT